MTVDDPATLDLVGRSMVARIATLSRNGGRQLGLRRRYYAQSGEKGGPCVIEVAPEQIERLEGGAGSTDR
jgi:hypothetical protein